MKVVTDLKTGSGRKCGKVPTMSGDRTAGARGVLRRTAGCEGVEQREEEPEDEGDEDMRDGGVPFFVNRGGLPVNEDTWERMWRHVARIHPEGEAVGSKIRGVSDLPKVRTVHPFHL